MKERKRKREEIKNRGKGRREVWPKEFRIMKQKSLLRDERNGQTLIEIGKWV